MVLALGAAVWLSAGPGMAGDRSKQLEGEGIFEYPAVPPPVDAAALTVSPLDAGDIAPDFSNLRDLAWLEPVAREKKLFFLGETHYSRGIYHLAARILFALNTFDHYGLLSLEFGYSTGLFLDRFLELRDDSEADALLAAIRRDLSLPEEILVLAQAIRRWNDGHPRRRIRLAAHDIEHDWRGAIGRVVAPYLCRGSKECSVDPAALDFDELGPRVRGWAREVGRRRAKPGEFPGKDDALVVLSNLEAVWESYRGGPDADAHRQRAIVRNLTDPGRLGRFLRAGKAMLWVGTHHATTRQQYPKGRNFLSEGSYLSHDFPATRGRTYSVMAWSLAFSFAHVAAADLSGCTRTDYWKNVDRYQSALARGLVNGASSYRFGRGFDHLEQMVIARAASVDHRPVRIEHIDWEKLLASAPAGHREGLVRWRDHAARYDALVIIPRSPIVGDTCLNRPAPPLSR